MKKIFPGNTLPVKVKEKKDFGIWVSYENFKGLIKITDIAFKKSKTSEIFNKLKEGDEINVLVTKVIDGSTEFVGSIKALHPEEDHFNNYAVGDTCKGRVFEKRSYGCFVEIEDEILGFLNGTQAGELNVNDEVMVKIKNIDHSLRKIDIDLI